MKKQYVAPEFDKIIFDVEDIITHSMAISNGDNVIDWGDFLMDESGNMQAKWLHE